MLPTSRNTTRNSLLLLSQHYIFLLTAHTQRNATEALPLLYISSIPLIALVVPCAWSYSFSSVCANCLRATLAVRVDSALASVYGINTSIHPQPTARANSFSMLPPPPRIERLLLQIVMESFLSGEIFSSQKALP